MSFNWLYPFVLTSKWHRCVLALLCIGFAVILLLSVSFLCSLSIYRRKEF